MAILVNARPPCVLHEDDHLLVVNKPPGWNTHAPSPFASEGIYDWLRHREPRWGTLAIVHRLDKETSGLLVFGKTSLANRSLTQQFTQHAVRKRYLFLTDRPVARPAWHVESSLVRTGERYVSQRTKRGERAETVFQVLRQEGSRTRITAEPQTGRTHQIRVHASESAVPVLGDTLYGGSPFHRVCLHAESLTFEHPATGSLVTFEAPADFATNASRLLRAAIIDPTDTDCFRIIHGASDGEPGWYVDRLGDWLLSQSETALDETRRSKLAELVKSHGAHGAYHKRLSRQVQRISAQEARPQLICGEPAPERFHVRENSITYELSFAEGYSVGLFLDQRDNRHRLLTGHVAGGFSVKTGITMLNLFAYTCGFSVCAARAGARTTSLDLSRSNLAWGRRNFELNGLDLATHDSIFGDAFDWLRRLAKKGRRFDLIVLDPPTFSQSKKASSVFRVEKDLGRLVVAALPLLDSEGTLLTSTNAAKMEPEQFLHVVEGAVQQARRKMEQRFYAPQPPDFPTSRLEPPYLKTCWWRLD